MSVSLKSIFLRGPRNLGRTLANGSTDHRILAAVLTISSLTSLTRLTAMVKELAVAWSFGTGDAVEAYLIAYLIPTVGITVIASSLNVSFIPTYIRVREHEGLAAAQRLLSAVTVWILVLLSIVAVAIMAGAQFYLPWLASGFGAPKLNLTLSLVYILTPTMLLSGISNIWGAVLNAGERFALVALTPIITPLITPLLVIFAKPWGAFALAAGILIGSLLETTLLGLGLRLRGVLLKPRWYGYDSNLRRIAGQFSHRIVAGILRSGSNVVDRSMAAMLPAGSLAALNYGNKITTGLLVIIGSALGSAITPYLSKMVAHKEWSGLRQTLRRYLWAIFLFTAPLTAVLFLFSWPITQILYERGSFTADDTSLVSQIQAFYALQLPLSVAAALVGRLLSAFLAAHIILRAAVINLILNIGLNILFIKFLGVAGIALSTTCSVIVTFCYLAYQGRRLLRDHVRTVDPIML